MNWKWQWQQHTSIKIKKSGINQNNVTFFMPKNLQINKKKHIFAL